MKAHFSWHEGPCDSGKLLSISPPFSRNRKGDMSAWSSHSWQGLDWKKYWVFCPSSVFLSWSTIPVSAWNGISMNDYTLWHDEENLMSWHDGENETVTPLPSVVCWWIKQHTSFLAFPHPSLRIPDSVGCPSWPSISLPWPPDPCLAIYCPRLPLLWERSTSDLVKSYPRPTGGGYAVWIAKMSYRCKRSVWWVSANHGLWTKSCLFL